MTIVLTVDDGEVDVVGLGSTQMSELHASTLPGAMVGVGDADL